MVSHQEMQIASMYDVDKNGVLDDEERLEAIKALKGGLETKQRFRDESPLVEAINLGKLNKEELDTYNISLKKNVPSNTPLRYALDSRNNAELSKSAKNTRRHATQTDMLKIRR